MLGETFFPTAPDTLDEDFSIEAILIFKGNYDDIEINLTPFLNLKIISCIGNQLYIKIKSADLLEQLTEVDKIQGIFRTDSKLSTQDTLDFIL